MKKELIKSSLIVVLFFLIGNVQAQQNDFGKRKHKSRTSIYKVKGTAPSNQTDGPSKQQNPSTHLRKASSITIHQYRWSNTPPRNPNEPIPMGQQNATPLKKADLENSKVTAIARHRTRRSTKNECKPFSVKRHKKRTSQYK